MVSNHTIKISHFYLFVGRKSINFSDSKTCYRIYGEPVDDTEMCISKSCGILSLFLTLLERLNQRK
jgi:hypothetical protein